MARALPREELLALLRKHGAVQSVTNQVLAGTSKVQLGGATYVLAGSPLDDEARSVAVSTPVVRSAPPATPARTPEPVSDDAEDIGQIALRRMGGERTQPPESEDASRDIADLALRRMEDEGPFAA